MSGLKKKYILFFTLLFFVSGCSTGKLFYDYGDGMVSWQVDNYFDLTSKQESWIEDAHTNRRALRNFALRLKLPSESLRILCVIFGEGLPHVVEIR